jgi:hypothetical protein
MLRTRYRISVGHFCLGQISYVLKTAKNIIKYSVCTLFRRFDSVWEVSSELMQFHIKLTYGNRFVTAEKYEN